MNSASLNDLFRQFLETRAPLLFLIGSIALAILGNAIYELLTTTFGATPQFLIALVIGATLIFTFAALALRHLLHLMDRLGVDQWPHVEPDQRAEPHAGLILPVGLSATGAEAAILAWHQHDATLRHCWLLVSPEVQRHAKFGDLRQSLLDHGVIPHIVPITDAIQAAEIYATVRATLVDAARFTDATPLIADITSGTKAMSVGTVLACLAARVPVQYWSAPRDKDGKPRRLDEACAMKVVVHTLEEPT